MNYIVFDLEATCWETQAEKNKNRSEIIEIGAVKINKDLEIIDTFQLFIKPKVNPTLTTFCTNLTTITQLDVDGALMFPQAVDKFKSWIGPESYYLCSWGDYDKRQLRKDCELHRLDISWLDQHTSVKHQYAQINGIDLKTDRRAAGMKAALRQLGIKLEGTHHRADSDAKNIAKIFIKIFPQLKF